MAELIKCPNENCQQYINLEIDIIRDTEGNIFCSKCGTLIRRD